ncbi:TPA: hypothetical protein ACMDQP_003599 [Vibrio cholerae]
MFEKVVLRRSEGGIPVTKGEIAEALLFYQNIHIIIDYASFHGLVTQLGMDLFLRLLALPCVTAVYTEEILSTYNDNNEFLYAAIKFVGDQERGELHSRKKRLQYQIEKMGFDRKKSLKYAERFLKLVSKHDLSSDHFVKNGITRSARIQLQDQEYVNQCAQKVVANQLGKEEIDSRLFLNVDFLDNTEKFKIHSNIDFDFITFKSKRLNPNGGDFNQATLLNQILESHADLLLSSHYGGDFFSSSVSSQLINIKFSQATKRTELNKSELASFKHVVLNDFPSVKEVIDSDRRSFSEFLKLLEKSDRFKKWTVGVNPDVGVVSEYLNELGGQHWLERTPGKTIRYALGSTISAFEPFIGSALSLADTLITDKLAIGWKPNHFVNKHVKPFLNEE